jgi:hypothetical protein
MTEFMSKIEPLIFNLAESTGYTSFGYDFATVGVGQMASLASFPLSFSQVLFGLTKQPGVSDLLTVRKVSKVFKPNINANNRAFMYGLFKLIFNRKANKPIVKTVPA